MSNGLIHLYHGDGKGKTTAAMGLAVRALGCGRRVVIVQFLKGGATGELEPLQTLALQTENLRRALAEPADLLILDEACAAWNLNMVDRELLQNAVLHKPAEQELAMTGRDPAPWMLDAADYITEMCCRRHPYEKGIPARKGVEF